MDQQPLIVTVIGMAVVTYIPRLLPVWLLSARALPRVVISWLRHVPVAVLAAMLAPSLVLVGEQATCDWNSPFLWAALPTLLIAWKTRSLFGSVITGMLVVAAVRYIF